MLTSCFIGKTTRSRSHFSAEQGVIQKHFSEHFHSWGYTLIKTKEKSTTLGILLILFLFNSSLVAKPIAELGELIISEKDLLIEKKRIESFNDKNDYSNTVLLSGVFEKKLWEHLLYKFKISPSYKAKVAYFKKYHPKLITREYFDLTKEYNKDLINAFEDILNKKLTEDEAYEKYINKNITKNRWESILKKDINVVSAIYKKEINKTYSDHVKEIMHLLSLSSTYAKGAVNNKICELKEVKKKLARVSCSIEASVWIKSYLENNLVLHDEKYKGFEKSLSFIRELQHLDYPRNN